MKVSQAYKIYQTPKNLQEHMLRTAALAKIILEHWRGMGMDKQAIIKACCIHDIAKPINFDLAKQAQFGMAPEDIEQLRQLQERIKNTLGPDEHQATVGIAKEIGCSENTIRCIDNLEWKYIPRLLDSNDLSSLVPIYCDMRIGPKGILPLDLRLEDLKNRTSDEEYGSNILNGNLLELVIQKNTAWGLNTIGGEELNLLFPSLEEMEI